MGSPEGRATFRAVALAIFEASAQGSGTFKLTLSELTPIPEPTVAWMIGTGLLVLAGTRRRSV